MKPLSKKETLERKKAKAIKDLAEGVDKFTSFIQHETLNTFRELEQFKHGIHPTQERLKYFRESGNRKIYK